jgi:allantoate deiminase
MDRTYVQPAVRCDETLTNALAVATGAVLPNPPRLPSGATHDASAMADLCSIAMLFLRCKNGISHKPEEFATSEDMGTAIGAIAGFLKTLKA